ncbi:extracellular solute-binding protein [Arthrobacter sp. NPDC093128]|uniref:ABC transporter substrate-binding protein n=1 Tax=Arthrobacter sp. NPDC093128 TaxID=3154979 RepID=UPI00343A0533
MISKRKTTGSQGIRAAKKFWALGSTVLTVIALTACGGGSSASTAPADTGGTTPEMLSASQWDELVKQGTSEGNLTIFSSQAGTDVLFKEFEKAYPGIKVTVDREATTELIGKLDQQLSAGAAGADVAFHTQIGWFADRANEKTFAPLRLGPDAQKEPAYKSVNRYVAPVLRYPLFLGYNTSAGSRVSSIEDLVQKAGNTTVGLLDPASSVAIKSQYQAWEDAYPGVLEKLSRLKTVKYPSTVPMGQALASGEIGYAVGLIPGVVPPLKANGAPVEEVVPASAVAGVEDNGAVLSNAPHPAAAQLFLNWLMSPDAQELLTTKLAPMAAPINPDSTKIKWESLSIYDPQVWTQQKQDDFMAHWKSLFQK